MKITVELEILPHEVELTTELLNTLRCADVSLRQQPSMQNCLLAYLCAGPLAAHTSSICGHFSRLCNQARRRDNLCAATGSLQTMSG